MPDYQHEIFLSYRRLDGEWLRWTHEILVPILKTLLQPALGEVNIYTDRTIETGTSWPTHLASHLARSRIMVAVLCRDYFRSDWCKAEIAHMYQREKLVGFRTVAQPSSLIFPLVIDDGDCFPREVQEMQYAKIHQFAQPFMDASSPKREELAEHIKNHIIARIESMLENTPTYDPAWKDIATKDFQHLFEIQTPTQTKLPAMGMVTP